MEGMMFAKDRDLVVLEPVLHRDVAWVGQRRISTTGSIVGTSLTLNTGSFIDSEIAAGHVVIFDDAVLEVVSIESATQATVSLMRASVESNAIPRLDATNRSVVVYDYSPQLAIVHRQVLTMIGLDPDDADFDESVVTNPGALVRLEALGTLHLIYAGAAAPGRGGSKFEHRAKMYQQRFVNERERVVAMIDLDGDGIAEVVRRPNLFVLERN
jgi:hypothetical protein